MSWASDLARAALRALTILLGLVAIALFAVFIVANTPWGHERVRRMGLSIVQGMAHGKVTIGTVDGNLLTGLTMHDVSIRDSSGAPFLAADELSARYSVWPLLHKKVHLTHVRVVRPMVVLDQPPNGVWNYERIFPSTRTMAPSAPSWGSWLRFTNVTVIDGHLLVRTPWSPTGGLPPAAQDSVIRAALAGQSRLVIVRAPGGYQKVVELRHIDAQLPLLQLSDPGARFRIAQVASLRMEALFFRPPAADVRDMRGRFLFDDDSLFWHGVSAALPASRVSGDGSYVFATGDMLLRLHGAPVALADLRWLYPRLPSQGSGQLDFNLSWAGGTEDYYAYNAEVTSGTARVTGSVGFLQSDTFAIHDTNLRFANVDTRLLEQLIPGFTSPRRGTFTGHATVQGGTQALAVNGEVAFDDRRAGRSDIAAHGEVGFGDGLRARNLRLQLRPLQVAMARTFAPTLPIAGTLRGTAYLNGSTRTELTTQADVELLDRGTRSAVNGRATIHLAGAKWLNVDATAHPVSLVELGRLAPVLGLQGAAAGPIHMTGTLDNLQVRTDLHVIGGGRLVAAGRLDLTGEKSYDLAVGLHVFNLRRVLAKAPSSSLTLQATARGTGTDPATMRAVLAADLRASSLDTVGVDSGTIRISVANGVADVAQLRLNGSRTHISASGNFGLARGSRGDLTYRVAVDSLGDLDRLLPRAGPDTGYVRPRPGRIARAMRRHRADSTRAARATEVERMATGRKLPRIPLDTPRAVPVALAGSLYAEGTLRGNLYDFDLAGRLTGKNPNVHGYTAHQIQSEYAWTGARTPTSTMALTVNADSVTAAGFEFDSLAARVSKHDSTGRVELLVRQGSEVDYTAKGDYILAANLNQLLVSDLRLRFDTTMWAAARPAVVYWGSEGIRVDGFDIRSGATGRVYVNGLLPTKGEASLEVAVQDFPVANVVDLLQSDVNLTGLLSLSGAMKGTMADPTFRGAFGLLQASYNGTPVPDMRGTFGYAERLLTSHVDALRTAGPQMATVDARVPINLALQGVTGSRLIDAPLALDVVADSLPLELIPQLTEEVSDVHGLAAGRVAMRGTWKRPSLAGGLLINHGHVKITYPGVTVSNIAGSVRMRNDTVYVDSIVGDSRGPIRMRGTVGVGSWRAPTLNLYLVAHRAEVLNSDRGQLRADAGLALSGPLTGAYLSGQVIILGGVIYAPEPTGRHVISAGDPGLFNVLDTTQAASRRLFPTQSPALQHLRMEVQLEVERSTWVRNREANVEIYTDYPVMVRLANGTLALTGAVATDRGEYTFMSKRFQIARGSAVFTGTEELNPLLQVTGEYDVQPPNSPVLTIKVLVGGTLRHPSLELDSDAQPPRSQSELLSLLAFGTATTSLIQPEGSSIASVGTPGDLVGVGAALAVKRLEGVALGVAIEQLQTEAGRAVGTDFFTITPGATPEVTQLLGGSNLRSFLADTRVEAGKYLNSRTFLGIQEQNGLPGLRLEYRTPNGWRYNLGTEPRVILRPPTLTSQPWYPRQQVGAFIIHEWKW